MNEPIDITLLSNLWLRWARIALLAIPRVDTSLDNEAVTFASNEISFHLRRSDGWWVIDTTDDRGSLHPNLAKFSDFEMVEKYLIWQWSSTARNAVRLPRLGPDLYALGHDSRVQFLALPNGQFELRSQDARATLMEPAATIFSHLMLRSTEDILADVSPDSPPSNSQQSHESQG